MAHSEDKQQTSEVITTHYYHPNTWVFFIEVAFARFDELFYLKYFNFKDWMKYTLKSFLKCSTEVHDDGVIAETCTYRW
jgi:hypothetical protein